MNKYIFKVTPPPESIDISGITENGHHSAFTLAETMIVLVILGIIASITVPAVVKRQMEAANRARIKKSMTVYDMAVNKFIIENQLKSDEAVYQIAPKGDCRITSQYFKVAENIEENGNKNLCKFKSADGVWWDISDILNPMIALKKDELGTDAETSFQLSAKFDQNGSLRVDDLAYETKLNSDAKKSLTKLYNFINNEKGEIDISSLDKAQKYINTPCPDYCDSLDHMVHEIGSSHGNDVEKMNDATCYGCLNIYSNGLKDVYDEKGNMLIRYRGCNSQGNNCLTLTIIEYDNNGKALSSRTCDLSGDKCTSGWIATYNERGDRTSTTSCAVDGFEYTEPGKSCAASTKEYDSNGNIIRISTCSGVNCSLESPTYSELYEYDSNGNKTGQFSFCDGSNNKATCKSSLLWVYDDNGITSYRDCKGSSNTSDCDSYTIALTNDNVSYYYDSKYNEDSCSPLNSTGVTYCENKGFQCMDMDFPDCPGGWDDDWNCIGGEVMAKYYYCNK